MRDIDKIEFIPANAICFVCGTAEEHPVTGYCKNDHDDWVEESEGERIINLGKKFKKSPTLVLECIRKNISINMESSEITKALRESDEG